MLDKLVDGHVDTTRPFTTIEELAYSDKWDEAQLCVAQYLGGTLVKEDLVFPDLAKLKQLSLLDDGYDGRFSEKYFSILPSLEEKLAFLEELISFHTHRTVRGVGALASAIDSL